MKAYIKNADGVEWTEDDFTKNYAELRAPSGAQPSEGLLRIAELIDNNGGDAASFFTGLQIGKLGYKVVVEE